MGEEKIIPRNKCQDRDYGLDLLRVVLMLMIPMLHFCSHGNMGSFFSTSEIGWYIIRFLNLASVCAVNVFVFISGYFMVDKKMNVKRILTTAGAIWFYSWSWLIVGKFTAIGTYDFKSLLICIFPISFKLYWFPTCYMIMSLLSPFLNKMLANLSHGSYKGLLFIGGALLCVWHDMVPMSDPLLANNGYSVMWFIYLYCVAGYFRLHGDKMFSRKAKTYFGTYIALTTVMLLVSSVLTLLSEKIYIIERYGIHTNFTAYCSILTLLQSCSLFLCFKRIRIKSFAVMKMVSFFAPLTFGVYLIHDNAYTRYFIYFSIFKVDTLPHNYHAVFALLGMILVLFIVCALVEWVRRKVFSLWENAKWFNSLCTKAQKKADEL